MTPIDEDEVELEGLEDLQEPTSEPDSPLLAPTQTQPKWLRLSDNSQWQRWRRRIKDWLMARLRPRKSWRYVLCVAVALYAVVCVVRGAPLFASPLPGYTGTYGVGAIDLEIPMEKPQRVSDAVFKGNGKSAFELQTTLFTLYYPVERGTRSKSTNPRHRWIDRPLSVTAEGYAKFAHVNNFIVRPIFTFALWAIAGSITIPAYVDAPLLAPGGRNRGEKGGAAATAGEATAPDRFPVMVFSHGMASSRTDYTNYLGELASRGYVVAAVEHRDGSCPGTVIKIKGQKDRKLIHFREADLISDPPMDTPRIKRDQLAFREAEMREVIRLLQEINHGAGDDIFKLNSRNEGQSLHTWTDRLNLKNLTISGHSYGATGALQALKHAPSPENPAVGGIILDPGKESGPLNAAIDVPILIVHSNTWSRQISPLFYGRPHFDTVRDLVRDVLNRTGSAWFFTSLGTAHPSVSDAPLIEPLLLSWTTGASMNVKQALKEYVHVSADFLEFLGTGGHVSGRLLTEGVTHEAYGKWVSKEREKEFPKDLSKLWEVHVSPIKR